MIIRFIIISNPYSSTLFRKYGTPEQVAKILDEIKATKFYEDKLLILSERYVFSKKDPEKLVSFDDIVAVYKKVYKESYKIRGYAVVLTDKYGMPIEYRYNVQAEKSVDSLLVTIAGKSKNAALGYTKQTLDHASKNRVELPKTNESYFCPDCGKVVRFGAKFCGNCGYRLDWNSMRK